MSAIATSAGVRDAHVVVPVADGTSEVARLSFDSGLAKVGLRADEQLTGLMAADFAYPLPLVWAAGALGRGGGR